VVEKVAKEKSKGKDAYTIKLSDGETKHFDPSNLRCVDVPESESEVGEESTASGADSNSSSSSSSEGGGAGGGGDGKGENLSAELVDGRMPLEFRLRNINDAREASDTYDTLREAM
jgi:hypothetical protein